ncbi:MAG TPA: c-type cytochrome [Bryobacteraceae bacterium]|nr:c-type cytochrome [Bryobacteraceae bacterium]
MGRDRSILLVFWVLGLCLASAAQVVKPKNPLGNGLEVVAEGHTLYNKTCTACHGRDGTQGDRAPALGAARRYFRLSEAAIFDAIKNGIPGTAMPASGLQDTEIWRIVAYIRNIRSTASDNDVPGDIQNGTRIYQGKGGCASCHMIRGQGGLIGPDLSSVGAQLTLDQIKASLTQSAPPQAGFVPVRVTTLKGEVIKGVAKNEDAFSIAVLDMQGKLHLFTKEELRNVAHEPESLMPRNLDKTLTPAEFQDLIAMLSRQARTKVRREQQGENEVGR